MSTNFKFSSYQSSPDNISILANSIHIYKNIDKLTAIVNSINADKKTTYKVLTDPHSYYIPTFIRNIMMKQPDCNIVTAVVPFSVASLVPSANLILYTYGEIGPSKNGCLFLKEFLLSDCKNIYPLIISYSLNSTLYGAISLIDRFFLWMKLN